MADSIRGEGWYSLRGMARMVRWMACEKLGGTKNSIRPRFFFEFFKTKDSLQNLHRLSEFLNEAGFYSFESKRMIYIVREKKVILSMIELRKCKSMIYIYI